MAKRNGQGQSDHTADQGLIALDRPRGLVPGSLEWLREREGPRLVKRLVDEVHAGNVGEMTPTQARCASMLLDRVLPQVSAVHHTVETTYANMSEEELRREFLRLTSRDAVDVQTIHDIPRSDRHAHSSASE